MEGTLVQFIFRGDEIVAEKTGDNIIRLIRGYDLTASEADHARTYYHYASDEMGSITHVVTGQEKDSAEGGEVPDQNGEVPGSSVILNRYEYDAWGNLSVCEEQVENRFRFNGQQYDPITQQYYLRARYYNPVIARFTQEDTYRGDGLNLYTYCRNNPVRYMDPSGHWCDRKENVYQGLLEREGLTADTVDPDTRLRLMAEAANQVRRGIPFSSENRDGNLGTNSDFYVTSDGQVILSAVYNLPSYDNSTTHSVLVMPDGRVLVRFESGDKDPRYVNYANDGHTEQKAAMYMKEHGITEAVLYHNNDGGTCGWCRTMTSTFLPEGYSLTVVPPINAVAANSKAVTYPMTFIGNSNLPKITPRYKIKHKEM